MASDLDKTRLRNRRAIKRAEKALKKNPKSMAKAAALFNLLCEQILIEGAVKWKKFGEAVEQTFGRVSTETVLTTRQKCALGDDDSDQESSA